MGSVNKVSAPWRYRINIGSLPPDVRLAILSIRKSAAANLAHLACCIPAILDAAPIGFRFIDVSCSHVCHDDRSGVPADPMDLAYGYENGLVPRQPNETDLESAICWRLLWLASTLGRGNHQVLTNRSRFGTHTVQLFTDSLMV
jgi:hypothetical protein